MNRARFIAPARRELLLAVAYYSDKQPGLGPRFIAAVEEATARAVAFPHTGSPVSRQVRRLFLKDFPYTLVYRPDAEGVVAFAVAHHSRRPEYWRSRVQDR